MMTSFLRHMRPPRSREQKSPALRRARSKSPGRWQRDDRSARCQIGQSPGMAVVTLAGSRPRGAGRVLAGCASPLLSKGGTHSIASLPFFPKPSTASSSPRTRPWPRPASPPGSRSASPGVERPEPAEIGGAGVGLVDAADAPLATEHAVIDIVLIDAVAQAGRAQLEGHPN